AEETMRNWTPRYSMLSLLVRVLVLAVLMATIHEVASAQPPIPTKLRVDIADGNTAQLFISWDKVSGAGYYDLQRSTSPNSGWTPVTNCYGSASGGKNDTGFQTEVCRDSGVQVTNPPTYYYYQVAACDSNSNLCSSYTSPVTPNTPVSCNCNSSQ